MARTPPISIKIGGLVRGGVEYEVFGSHISDINLHCGSVVTLPAQNSAVPGSILPILLLYDLKKILNSIFFYFGSLFPGFQKLFHFSVL